MRADGEQEKERKRKGRKGGWRDLKCIEYAVYYISEFRNQCVSEKWYYSLIGTVQARKPSPFLYHVRFYHL